MIIDLGNFNYKYGNSDDWYTLVNRLKSMASMLDSEYESFLNELIADEGERMVLWTLPFSMSLESFKQCLRALQGEMLCNYESNDLELLKIEAVEKYHDSKWNKIDEIITLYTFTINGEKLFAEIYE